MKATCKPVLSTTRAKKNGKFPVKLRIIFQRFPKLYGLGIDMTQEEFNSYHLNKKLKHQFDNIVFQQKRADTIIAELQDGFTWEAFESCFRKNAP